ncbi:hypothetical protein QA584_12685 [Anaerocolumna sp. AGMB13025]|uniref:hypothetical protein n=1 Tax=Anaerocolumna sp. AGMB13025 TaxID=3039116 RepID=UPI00241E9D7B|nr:hypothetical protein [Anaerocolumna sp. AGMB13025]WFR59896.1 hypothetical protein QA584_12685 [Anaerocolumna sp. AGMB13025]
MDTLDIIKELNMCKGYQFALLSTYSCDINFINKVIIAKMLEQGCNKIILFTDRRMLTVNLMRDYNVTLGNKYIINTIKTDYAFHPKVFLLLGKEKAKLMVGSGNLTCAGMLSNTEVFTKYEYSEGNEEELSIIQSAYRMFQFIAMQNSIPLQNKVFYNIRDLKYLSESIQGNNAKIWIDNMRMPIIDQLLTKINDQIKSIDIIVPFFDSKCKATYYLRDVLKVSKCNIYVQNRNSNLMLNRLTDDIKAYCFNKFNQSNNFYHAKVFILHGIKNDYVLYGSANCSTVALSKNVRNGNYEACIFEKGKSGCFDYYLNCIEKPEKIKNIDFIAVKDGVEKLKYLNTYFEFALLATNGLEIILKQSKPVPIKEIHINNKSVLFSQNENGISILLESPDGLLDNKSVFEITVKEKEQVEYQLIGWYLDEQAILYTHDNRKEIIRHKIMNGLWTSDLSCILDIVYEFIEKACWSFDELTQSAEYIKKKQESEIEINESINDNLEDYIVEDILSETKDINYSSNPRSLLSIFYEFGMKRFKHNKSDIISYENPINYNESTKNDKIETSYTDYEKKWLVRQLNGLLDAYYKSLDDEKYMLEANWNSFWEKNIAVLEFARKLIESDAYVHFQTNSKILFPLDELEIINMYYALLDAIVRYKRKQVMAENSIEVLISLSTYSIIWMFKNAIVFNDDLIVKAKKALDLLRQFIDNDNWFRDNYCCLVSLTKKSELIGYIYQQDDIVSCFEELFSYHSPRTALERLKTMLNSSFEIREDGHIELIASLNSKSELHPFNGQIRAIIRETIITMRMVNKWKEASSITVTFIAEIGNIRKYSICYSPGFQRMEESIRYAKGNDYNTFINRLDWGL